MPCLTVAPGVKLNVADDRFLRKRYLRCPTCECITETVVRFEAYYGISQYCCKCGDAWEDGWLRPRPFTRSWRRLAVSRFRRLWEQATFGPDPTFEDLYPEVAW